MTTNKDFTFKFSYYKESPHYTALRTLTYSFAKCHLNFYLPLVQCPCMVMNMKCCQNCHCLSS